MRISPRLAFAQRRADAQQSRPPARSLAFARRRYTARQLASDKQLEARYADALVRVVRRLHNDVTAAVVPKLGQYAHADAANPFSGDIDGIALQHIASVPRVVSPLFARHAADVSNSNAQALRVVGIPPTDLRLGPVIAAKRDENIGLVEKAMRAYASDVRELFDDPNTFGMRVEDIQAKLVERGNVSESRAELIARDQTLKLNSAITKTRQENVGITKYVWSTSLDERVREEHRALEGQTFEWSSPPPVGHPGEDFQCRCVAVPVIDSLGGITDFPQIPETPEALTPIAPPALEEGTHVGEIELGEGVSDEEKTRVLEAISDAPTLDFLSRNPLNKLAIKPQVSFFGLSAAGVYNEKTGELQLSSTIAKNAFGRAFRPGQTRLSWYGAASKREAIDTVLRHELGHHIHLFEGHGTGVDKMIGEAYARAVQAKTFITVYAGSSAEEYFAESYAMYQSRPVALKAHDPNGFAMVESVLRARGILQ